MIKRCTCKSPFQDTQYGLGMRVFTEGKKDASCTVCNSKLPLPVKEGKPKK